MLADKSPASAWNWAQKNLLSPWYNTVLTMLCLLAIAGISWELWSWATTLAQWAVVQANWRLFLVGRYPANQVWRLGILGAIVLFLLGFSLWSWWTKQRRFAALLAWLWVLMFPVGLWLMGGGWGLTRVATSRWQGLLLTLLLALVSTGLSFPLGVGLALGRQGNLPLIRWACTLYIELIRGTPLIVILFLMQNMLPLLTPAGSLRPDNVLRAITGLTLFSAAYLAENVRGGLQAIPRGQIEAARALGLSPVLIASFIVLPQALRVALPAIVGQFIGLFKDTSLVSLVQLVELTGTARTVLGQPQFSDRFAEVYLVIGLIYWLFCYSLSLMGRRLERQLAAP
jgi:general L-amino acid transport system permease protein